MFNLSGLAREITFGDSLHHGRHTDHFSGETIEFDDATSLAMEPWSYRVFVR